MMITIIEEALIVLNQLNKNGFEAYLVGGCVRDFCLDKTPNDYDVTTNALPNMIKEVFKDFKTLDIGIKHGTVGVLVNSVLIEVTTYRIDGEYLDNRHPKEVLFTTSIKEDLSRRDFTINALALSSNNDFIDFFGGLDDLKNRVIKAVGDPDLRFKEDALRILRGLRFSSVLSFNIESNTAASILKNKALLDNISKERINVEFNKLLLGQNKTDVLLKYKVVIAQFIPLISTFIFDDKYILIVKMISKVENDLILILTLLLSEFSSDEVITTLQILKYDFKQIANIKILLDNLNIELYLNKTLTKQLMKKMGYDLFVKLIKVRIAMASVIDILKVETYKKMIVEAEDIIKNDECYRLIDLNIDGNDLYAIGITGVMTGEILRSLLDAVIEDKCLNDKKELLNFALNLKTQQQKRS